MHAEKETEDLSAHAEASDATEDSPLDLMCGRGIAEVLFPANPPTPVNPRVIRRLGFEEERKTGDLATAAGLFLPKRVDPEAS